MNNFINQERIELIKSDRKDK